MMIIRLYEGKVLNNDMDNIKDVLSDLVQTGQVIEEEIIINNNSHLDYRLAAEYITNPIEEKSILILENITGKQIYFNPRNFEKVYSDIQFMNL